MAVPFRIRRAEWVAGALVVLTVVTLMVGFLLVARARGAFAAHYPYSVTMADGYGIAPGATVEMLGIEVGRVDTVAITDDNRVRIAIAVDGQYAGRIRKDSVVRVKMSLGLQTMLGGVALVISPGSADAELVPTHGELPVVEPSKITDLLPGVGGDAMLQDIETILANTRVLTEDLTKPESEIRKLLADVTLLVASLQRGEGTVGKLLKDDAELYRELTATLLRVESTLKQAEGLMGKGGKLIDKSDSVLTSSKDLLSKTDGVITDAGAMFRKIDPVVDDAGHAMGTLGETVSLFGETTRELSEVLAKMDRVVDDVQDITRATKKIFPIRRHLDDKNSNPLVDGPTR